MIRSRLQFGVFSLVKTYLHIAPNRSRSPAMLYSRIFVWLDLFPHRRLERWPPKSWWSIMRSIF